MSRGRIVAFVGILLAAVGVAVATVSFGLLQAQDDRQPTLASRADSALDFDEVRAGPHIAFRSTALGSTYGLVAVVPLDRPDGPRAASKTACERVDAARASGWCLTAERGAITTYRAMLLDAELAPRRQVPMVGTPSRARLSPDGRFAAMTTFVTGHSYAQAGFSTATTIDDVSSGRSYGNLEEFRFLLDGKLYRSADLNVWGVTFATDDRRFYATAASKGKTWLVEGDLQRRELRSLRENAECPSLSPDGTKIAYKKRATNQPGVWRLQVLDLETGHETALAETRTVDDQVEWLDDTHVLYGMPREGSAETDVWITAADGTGKPRVLIPRAWSPAVVR